MVPGGLLMTKEQFDSLFSKNKFKKKNIDHLMFILEFVVPIVSFYEQGKYLTSFPS